MFYPFLVDISFTSYLTNSIIGAVFLYLILAFCISCLLLFASYVLNSYLPVTNSEKSSSYECGFDPFNDARDTFYIKFYLISILFIIFDIETIYFFPWVMSFYNFSILSFYVMAIFFFFLVIGFWYEWRKSVLDFD